MQITQRGIFVLSCLMLLSLPVVTTGEETAGARLDRSIPRKMGRAVDPNISIPLPATPEPAVVTSVQDAHGTAALAMIGFPWQELGYKVSFLGRRPGFRALTLVEEHRIEVYVKAEETPNALAFDLAHEFGHVVDLKYNDEARRKRWRELRGIAPDTPWYGASACSDYATPAGDFAETFAYLLLGPGSYHSRMAPPPTPAQIRELAEFCGIKNVSERLLTAAGSAY